jgi:hypothetical protein
MQLAEEKKCYHNLHDFLGSSISIRNSSPSPPHCPSQSKINASLPNSHHPTTHGPFKTSTIVIIKVVPAKGPPAEEERKVLKASIDISIHVIK